MPKDKNISKMYKQQITCTNCGRAQHFVIPKGTSVFNYLQTAVCSKCGCNPLHQPIGEGEKVGK